MGMAKKKKEEKRKEGIERERGRKEEREERRKPGKTFRLLQSSLYPSLWVRVQSWCVSHGWVSVAAQTDLGWNHPRSASNQPITRSL